MDKTGSTQSTPRRTINHENLTCLDCVQLGEKEMSSKNFSIARNYFLKAIELKTNDRRLLNAIYSQLGNCYFIEGNFEGAIEYHKFDKYNAQAIKDKFAECKACVNLSTAYRNVRLYVDARNEAQNCVCLAKELNNNVMLYNGLLNLGLAFHLAARDIVNEKMKDMSSSNPYSLSPITMTDGQDKENHKNCLESARDIFIEMLEIGTNINKPDLLLRAHERIAGCLYELREYKEAIEHFQKALYHSRGVGAKAKNRLFNSNIGSCYVLMKRYDEAKKYYTEALEIAKELEKKLLIAHCHFSLGYVFILSRETKCAIKHFLQHFKLSCIKKDYSSAIRSCSQLITIYNTEKEYSKVFYFIIYNYHLASKTGSSEVVNEAMNCIKLFVKDHLNLLGDSGEITLDNPFDGCSILGSDNERLLSKDELLRKDIKKIIFSCSGKKVDEEDCGLNRKTIKLKEEDGSDGNKKKRLEDLDEFFSLQHRLGQYNDQRVDVSALKDISNSKSQIRKSIGASLGHSFSGFNTFLKKVEGKNFTSTPLFGRKDISQTVKMRNKNGFKLPRSTSAYLGSDTSSLRGSLFSNRDRHSANLANTQEDILDQIANLQGRRMDDQRAELKLPGLNRDQSSSVDQMNQPKTTTSEGAPPVFDDNIYEIVIRSQSYRLNDQRVELGGRKPTIPHKDVEQLVQRMQVGRLDDQRCPLNVTTDEEKKVSTESVSVQEAEA
uniref:TPR_REGION domain-containing protein n=1 Tax=Parastrongyloides trichosuri TaxID=131310 RepID=A0A0N4Z464_PARTI